MKRLSNWFYKLSNTWIALSGLLIFILFTILVLPGQASNSEYADVRTPDLSFYYSPAELIEIAGQLGPAGRADYIRARFSFDLIWPLVYAFFLITSLSWLFAPLSESSPFRFANLAPFWGMVFDFLENLSTSWVMFRYPEQAGFAVALAPVFTMVKWSLIGLSFALFLGGILWRLVRWISLKASR